MWEWFNNDTTFYKKIEKQYGSMQESPINAVVYGRVIEFRVDPATTIEEMDLIYEWLNESATEAGLWHIPAKFRYIGTFTIGPAPTVTRTVPLKNPPPVKTYGNTWEEMWAREGSDYNYTRLWNWYEENRYTGDVWEKADAYYGNTANNPLNRIEYGWTITILTDPLSGAEMDRIYGWVNESMEDAGLRGIPVEFRYGEEFTVSGLTLTAEKDSVIRGPPQPNHLRSALLILCIAGVAAFGFSRTLNLPESPRRPRVKAAKNRGLHRRTSRTFPERDRRRYRIFPRLDPLQSQATGTKTDRAACRIRGKHPLLPEKR